MKINYTKDVSSVSAEMLNGGFFVGWPNPPSKETHLRILQNAWCSYVAIDSEANAVVGFINCISDGVLSAYIPLLEVLPEYQGQGIGKKLVQLMLDETKNLYMVDIAHDEDKIGFYAQFKPHAGLLSFFRNYQVQSGHDVVLKKEEKI